MWPRSIAPRIGVNELDKEPFLEWYARVQRHIPHVPANIAEHWIHRHWGHSPYEFLPLSRLQFERQTWPLELVREIAFGSRWTMGSDVTRLDLPMIARTPLAQMMIAAGTWPEPVIVLDNVSGSLDDLQKPMGRWHLLEGHLRLTYMRCLDHKGSALPEHSVWIARL